MFETTFHQDLNGDGIIGLHTVVIQVNGSTSLTEVGNSFYLYTNGVGPSLKLAGAEVTAGEFGGWTPIGAIQVAGGYDVAWKVAGADQYGIWSTDTNGNYLSSLTPAVVGSNATLEAFETTFHQDINGDGTIGVPPAAAAVPSLQSVSVHSATFDGTTLVLDTPSTFSGQIIGFTGDGTVPGSAHINLHGINYDTVHSSFDASAGSLAVSDGATTATLHFLGRYSSDSFHFADAGHGGTLILGAGQGASAASGPAVGAGAQDTFVFGPNFGQITIANFAAATSSIDIDHTVFADIAALLAATHDDTAGNAVITDAAHDTITLQHVSIAQLLTHQGDFHFV